MRTKIFAQEGRTALVAGLKWVPLTKIGKPGKDGRPGKPDPKEIRTSVAYESARQVVVVQAGDRGALGMYVPEEGDLDEPVDDGVKVGKPKAIHSLAAVFAAYVAKTGGGNGVLALSLPVGNEAVIIIVQNGVPTTDEVKSTEAVHANAMQYAASEHFQYPLFTNDQGLFPDADLIDSKHLWEVLGKANQIRGVPVNLLGIAIVLGVVVVVGAGAYGYFEYKAEAQRKERARLAAQANPTPKYLAALATQIGRLGADRAGIHALMNAVSTRDLWSEGWVLSGVACSVESGSCVSNWARAGGTTDHLISARERFGESIMGTSTKNLVQMEFKVDTSMTGVATRGQLPTETESIAVGTPIEQVWANATITVAQSPDGFKAWPQVPGIDMASVRREELVRARKVEITSTPGLVSELLDSAPSNIWWTDITYIVKPNGKASDSLLATIRGKTYVR